MGKKKSLLSSPHSLHQGVSSSASSYFMCCHLLCRRSKACCLSATAALGFCLVIYVGISSYQQQQQQQQVGPLQPLPLQPEVEPVPPGLPLKVTRKVEETGTGTNVHTKYVVETSTCKIPEMEPFDKSVKAFLKPDFGYPVDCRGSHKGWTFANGTDLMVNKSAVHESGYSMSSIYCCYRIITRVEQPWSDYDGNADNYVKYSDKCHPIHNDHVQIDAEFIRVHCISKLPPLYNDVVYRDFFAFAQSSGDRLVTKKLHDWKIKSQQNPTHPPPPNVVIIGIDNNSRMNSHRHLTKTLEVLRKIGAVEMLGYTKVGENTYPNTVSFVSGYSAKQIKPICYNSTSVPFDDCPFIWKAYDKANYITLHAEDTPYLGGFNYLRGGFIKKPTDFYLRPLMLAVMTYMPRFDYYHTDCIGRYMTDQFAFNYMLDVIRLSTQYAAPVFVHNWLTSLAHHSYNNLQYGDHSIANFIHSLVNISNDNTIFFFMSDHGQRYGPIRETTQGWYEDKLPTQWVYIPQRIRNLYPDWETNLQRNSGRLTSHFDVYKTMLHILKTFNMNVQDTEDVYTAAKYQFGLSFFEPIPENRTCEEAGVTVNFCACSKPRPMDIGDPEIVEAAEASVKHLAGLVPLDVCAVPKLKNIVSAGFLDLPGKPVYVITFVTEPGDFLFEVNVENEVDTGRFVITTDLLRMNKIARAADCVKTPLLERYCYCK